jgi:3-deoxy-7-phosphoheptulonate synthase
MKYSVIKKLPTPEEIISAGPITQREMDQIAEQRQQIKNIFEGKDSRLLIVVGPCSAWPNKAVLKYADNLVQLNERVKKNLLLVMRVYIQKPRTTKGWTGPVNQPNPLAYPDIEAGVYYARRMMVEVIKKGLPIADEALFTHNAKGFLELLSWVAIGARSTEDQEHRIFASAIDCPVGMKNPTHGSLTVGVNSILAAQSPHIVALDGYEVQTHGNPYAHLVLRGSHLGPNYSLGHFQEVQKGMSAHHIANPAVVVDASHDNCLINGKKDYLLQAEVVKAVMKERSQYPEIKKLLKGFMIESFLKEGCQKLDPQHPENTDWDGLSITDACLGWEKTEDLLLDLAAELEKNG